eukprot:9515411-Alexandrium_andersonii.AAC.1
MALGDMVVQHGCNTRKARSDRAQLASPHCLCDRLWLVPRVCALGFCGIAHPTMLRLSIAV